LTPPPGRCTHGE